MGYRKVSEMLAATSAAAADLVMLIQGGINKKLTVANLFSSITTPIGADATLTIGSKLCLKNTNVQSLSTSGSAINDTTTFTEITATAPIAINIGTSATPGLFKIISAAAADVTNTITISPVGVTGFTSIVFNAAGQSVVLMYHTSTAKWIIIANNGATITA